MENTVRHDRIRELLEKISSIPRASYKEEKIAQFIFDFARKAGCEAYKDGANNVLVNVRPTAGCEDAEPILLQGHTDMVCEKNGGVVHDFFSEGIKLCEKDGWLCADGTTLGADDGVALAIMLYIIEGGLEHHGEVQCLFTSAEEVGLDGAKSFDYSLIHAKRMINLDGGCEDEIIVGCAGGVRTDITFSPSFEPLVGEVVKLSIGGLCGGHSGEDIARGRSNANLILCELLTEIMQACRLSLVSISGGSKDNAIPREAEAVFATDNAKCAREIATEFSKARATRLSPEDGGFFVAFENTSAELMMDEASTKNIITFISCSKNGVLEMSRDQRLAGLVEFSKNLGVIRSEGDKVYVCISSRSAIDAQIEQSLREISLLASVCSAKTESRGRYPGWEHSPSSPLADEYERISRQMHGTKMRREVIHAGLECGIIKAACGELDCICCGPNIKDLHSPAERLELSSLYRVADVVCALVENMR